MTLISLTVICRLALDLKKQFLKTGNTTHILMKKFTESIKNSIPHFLLLLALSACSQDVLLERKTVLNNKISILLPDKFTIMDSIMLIVKYPAPSNRPTIVYTNDSGSINVAFSHTQTQANQDQLEEIRKILFAQITSNSSISNVSNNTKVINGIKFVLFEFFSEAVDTRVFNHMFITTLENRLLIGNFNCTEEHLSNWKPVGLKIINSIKLLK